MARITSIAPTGQPIDEKTATQIFDLVDKFASYGFNRSHAAAYGILSYRTAYLKCHYPHEFYAGSMNLDLNAVEKLADFATEMRRNGIRVTPPDVNRSVERFSVIEDQRGKSVLWALSGIKGVGVGAMEQLIDERTANGRFRDFSDFVARSAPFLNKRGFENLIKAGACDGLHGNRAAMLAGLEAILKGAQKANRDAAVGQASLFDGFMQPVATSLLPEVPDLRPLDKLWGEFDTLGMFVSGHPIQLVERMRRRRTGGTELRRALDPDCRLGGKEIVVFCLVTDIIVRMTKDNEAMAALKISDDTTAGEVVAFPKAYARHRRDLRKKGAYALTCSVMERDGERRLAVEKLDALDLDLVADPTRSPGPALAAAC